MLKRAVDVVVAALALVGLAPLLLGLALAIRLHSGGPVLFRQRRVGRHGASFTMAKFRTMSVGAEEARALLAARAGSPGLFKLPDDPRVTRMGRVLRRFYLDELPQLGNVLRGDMSLVGPRPLVPEEDALVTGYHRRRLEVRPGMTGPWQASGAWRIPLSWMVELDKAYASNWSLRWDARLLLATLLACARGAGR